MSRASRCRGTVKMLSVLTTDGRGSPSALPIETSVGSPREVRVTRATTTAPIVSQTASLVSTTTGRGPIGGGSSAHQTSALRIGPGRLAAPLSALDLGQLRQQGQLGGGDVRGLDVRDCFRLDVASQRCLDDVGQGTPLVTGEPPQFLLDLITNLNDHPFIIRCRTNLGNRGNGMVGISGILIVGAIHWSSWRSTLPEPRCRAG